MKSVNNSKKTLRSTSSFILAGLSGGHAVFHWFTQSFLVMLPQIKSGFGLSPIQVGAIMSTREITAAIITLPGGVIADLLRNHWGLVLAFCMGGFGLGWLVMGLSPVYPLLLLGMAIVSTASSLWHLPSMASLSHHFSHRRGVALSIHGVGGSIGDVMGPVLTGFLLTVLAWKGILTIYAIGPFLLAFVVFWAFKDIGKTSDSVSTGNMRHQIEMTKGILKNPVLWAINLTMGLRGMAFVAFITFLPLYMSDELGFSSGSVGIHIGLLVLIGIVAAPTLGYLSDKFGRKKILVPSMLLLCGFSLLLVVFGEGIMLTIIITLIGLFLYSDQPILTATALDIVGHGVATTTLGVLSFSRMMLGAASPLIAGYLYETQGIDAAFYYAAFLFATASFILLVIPLPKPSPTSHEGHRDGGHGHEGHRDGGHH